MTKYYFLANIKEAQVLSERQRTRPADREPSSPDPGDPPGVCKDQSRRVSDSH